ncbi:hypothetical protein FRB94_003027 [Tulasnella sp. JGI-2019a]|nr:hypothetical protein FRB94_003027 [Tulasnella sp. JGI-2019a]
MAIGSDIQSYVSAGEGATPRPCFIRDVLAMEEAGVKDWPDIFWLGAGKVPVRWVALVGMVVGVQAYEKRVLYTLDDGTDVVDCIYQIPKLPTPKQLPTPPTSRANSGSSRKGAVPKTAPGYSSSKLEKKTRTPYEEAETGWSTLAALIRPDIEVGTMVRVTGKVTAWKDGKQIVIESITPCPSSNDEAKHWLLTTQLHKTIYSKPFMIPVTSSSSSASNMTTPRANRVRPSQTRAASPYCSPSTPRAIKRQPSQRDHQPSTPPTTPPKLSLLTSSFDVDNAIHETPRLRHPAKLSSSQLTTNTFRIHVARYLDLAARQYTSCRSGKDKAVEDDGDDDKDIMGMGMGFSLSYLRRVPEIDALGRKVVEAEAKRRAKKEREVRREKEREVKDLRKRASSSIQSHAPRKVAAPSSERTSLKVKRLLEMTLRTLREDGAIISVEGPGRRQKSAASTGGRRDAEARRRCWRDATTKDGGLTASFAANATTTTTTSTLSRRPKHDVSTTIMSLEEDPPSSDDPDMDPMHEESFMPITPAVLCPPVLRTMKRIFGPYTSRNHKGVTVEDVTRRLRREDETWVKVLEEHVQRALESLVGDDGFSGEGVDDTERMVWRMRDGRWGLV